MAAALQRTQLPLGSAVRQQYSGRPVPFKACSVVKSFVRPLTTPVQAGRVCDLTGKRRNKANTVSFSNKHNRKWQYPNLQNKKVFWEKGQRWVKLKICTKAIKTLEKKGLDEMAKEAGINLWKLPFEDARPQRLQYLAENPRKVPVAVNPRAMKNPKKLAASRKQPRYPMYEEGGRIVWVRPGLEESITGVVKVVEEQSTRQELKVTVSE